MDKWISIETSWDRTSRNRRFVGPFWIAISSLPWSSKLSNQVLSAIRQVHQVRNYTGTSMINSATVLAFEVHSHSYLHRLLFHWKVSCILHLKLALLLYISLVNCWYHKFSISFQFVAHWTCMWKISYMMMMLLILWSNGTMKSIKQKFSYIYFSNASLVTFWFSELWVCSS